MVASESLNVLYCFPACTVMVGKSIIHATVMVSSTGGPPHSWDTLLREGIFGLNHHRNHWIHHLNCRSQTGSHQWWLLYFLSWCFDVILLELDEGLEDAVLLDLYEVCGLDLLQSLECVVCCTYNYKYLSVDDVMCFWEGICDKIWNNFCVSYCGCGFDSHKCVTGI